MCIDVQCYHTRCSECDNTSSGQRIKTTLELSLSPYPQLVTYGQNGRKQRVAQYIQQKPEVPISIRITSSTEINVTQSNKSIVHSISTRSSNVVDFGSFGYSVKALTIALPNFYYTVCNLLSVQSGVR